MNIDVLPPSSHILYHRDTRPTVMTNNPSYIIPNPLHLSTQNSSQGPRDTPLNTSPTAETSFHTYDIIRSPTQYPQLYHVLEHSMGRGLHSEGFTSTSSKAAAGKQQGTEEYSTLQHH